MLLAIWPLEWLALRALPMTVLERIQLLTTGQTSLSRIRKFWKFRKFNMARKSAMSRIIHVQVRAWAVPLNGRFSLPHLTTRQRTRLSTEKKGNPSASLEQLDRSHPRHDRRSRFRPASVSGKPSPTFHHSCLRGVLHGCSCQVVNQSGYDAGLSSCCLTRSSSQ